MDPPDTLPGEGYIPLAEYAAQHDATYQEVYGWVRWGHLAAERHAGRWWVPARRPVPHVRQGGWGQEARPRVIRADAR